MPNSTPTDININKMAVLGDDIPPFKCKKCGSIGEWKHQFYGHNHGRPIAEQTSFRITCTKCGTIQFEG